MLRLFKSSNSLTRSVFRLSQRSQLGYLQIPSFRFSFQDFQYRKQTLERKYTFNNTLISKCFQSFDCSLSFSLDQPFSIHFAPKQSELMRLSFPQPKEIELSLAILNSTISGFGRGNENVVDQSYRMAREYLPHQIFLPSIINEKVIQDAVWKISEDIWNGRKIKAKLNKLNIYPKGGLFKKHVDSPKQNSFGSLVVFLPCKYKGGDLIVEKGRAKHTYNFGAEDKNKINCVAFFNDCVHEITEVTEGCRLTLSYDLFYEQSEVDVEPKPELLKMFSKLQINKVYGYFCEHYYGNQKMKDSSKKMKQELMLKGVDYELYIAAKKSGAKSIELKVFYNEYFYKPTQTKQQLPIYVTETENIESEAEYQKQQSESESQSVQQEQLPYDNQELQLISSPEKIAKLSTWFNEEYSGEDYTANFFIQQKIPYWKDFDKVQWLNTVNQNSDYQYAVTGYHGNHYDVTFQYCQLILLIKF